MVRSVTRDLPEQGKNNPAVNQAAGNGGQKMDQYSWFTVYDDKLAEEYLKSTDTIRARKRTWLLYQILKDADALDRVRFGIYDLDVNQLRLPISHKLVPLAVTAVTGIKL